MTNYYAKVLFHLFYVLDRDASIADFVEEERTKKTSIISVADYPACRKIKKCGPIQGVLRE